MSLSVFKAPESEQQKVTLREVQQRVVHSQVNGLEA